MAPLLERGREAFNLYLSKLPVLERPIVGNAIHIVTREDFVANADLCLTHVEIQSLPTHVICESGILCVLVEKLRRH